MTPRQQRLKAFLDRLVDVPVTWGRDDCSAAPALWLGEELQVRIDLPAYSTREEAHALIAACEGGLVGLWDRHLPFLHERIGTPQPGDIGIIPTNPHGPMAGMPMGVICGTPGVALRRHATHGWAPIAPRLYLKVWALPDQQQAPGA